MEFKNNKLYNDLLQLILNNNTAIAAIVQQMSDKVFYSVSKEWDVYIRDICELRNASTQEAVEQALREYVADHDEFIQIPADARKRLGMKPYVPFSRSNAKTATG